MFYRPKTRLLVDFKIEHFFCDHQYNTIFDISLCLLFMNTEYQKGTFLKLQSMFRVWLNCNFEHEAMVLP